MGNSSSGIFVTGADTGVGKTFVAALFARGLKQSGRRVGVYKPVATGCQALFGGLVSEDATALWEAAGKPGELHDVCPQRFLAPLAPNLAARAEGKRVDRWLLRTGLNVWRERSDVIVVEGAGGLLSPVSDQDLVADLADDLSFPLVIVAANRIGVVNQALLTIEAAGARGLKVLGVILNRLPGSESDPSVDSNADELARRTSVKILADLPTNSESLPEEALRLVVKAIA